MENMGMLPGKILIIEDDLNLIRVLIDRLKVAGYEAVSAPDGKLGVEQAIEQLPDLIITDVMMPGLPGDYVVRELQADDRTKNISVIIMSGILGRDDAKRGLNINGKLYPALSKPFDAETLINLIGNVLKTKIK
ncbi:MAG: response regulator [Candidatus Omnitrophica bacterium]|nr:response regulator [Candidatus Omnitrophota bacterium]